MYSATEKAFFQAHFLRQSHLSPKQPFFVSQGTRGGEGLSDDTTTAVLETTIQVIITSNRKSHSKFYGLRRQPLVTPRNDVRNKHRNSTLMTCHYPDLRRASDWSCGEKNVFRKFASTNQTHYPDIAGRLVVTSRDVGCFFRLKIL